MTTGAQRNVYLHMKTLAEAKEILATRFIPLPDSGVETIATAESVGRILAEPIFARTSSPGFHAAAMDGVAVQAESTYGASQASPKDLIIGQEALFLNTGHVMPPKTDAVIMIEHVQVLDDARIRIEAPAFPWQHVRKMGEDIVATELLFARHHQVSPYCLGALIAGGIFNVVVKQPPRVLIIPTGSELVDWQRLSHPQLAPGQVYESNAFVLGRLVNSWGGTFVRHDPVLDDVERIRQAVVSAAAGEFEMVLVIGGSSAGSEDYAKGVIEALGEILFHGVTIMPGKPVICGKVNQIPVFGMPGYPISTIIAAEQFVRPLICRMLGQPEPEVQTMTVIPTRKVASKLGVEEFVRVKLGRVGAKVTATALPRGAGSITSITEADGIIRIPTHMEGLKENEPATAELLTSSSTIESTIVMVGSHDNTLDILADQIRLQPGGMSVSSSHVGSMGGLMAVKRGLCHCAGSHLLDLSDGSYNLSYIHKFLPEVDVKVVHLVMRDQGLIVAKGNPKQIQGIEDLSRANIAFINRQQGSGTRILLDYRLNQLGVGPEAIAGYDREEFTHMSVAAAVLSGAADAGLGIYAAAKALNLDFIPVVTEQYDLIIPTIFFDTPPIQLLLKTIDTPVFKQRVGELGGYGIQRTGEVIL